MADKPHTHTHTHTLSEDDVARAIAAFAARDPERRGIRLCDLGTCMRAMGEEVSEAEIFDLMCLAEVASEETNTLPFGEFLRLVTDRRQRLAEPVSEADLAMAFIACGGDPEDPESFVKKEKLVALVKGDFGLSIDISAMIESIDDDGSGQIEFDEFQQLL